MKNCRRCKIDKVSDEFSPDLRNRDGLQAYCKLCFLEYQRERRRNPTERDIETKRRNDALYYERHKSKINVKNQDRKLRMRYGITMDDYERMVVEQGGKCGICGTTEPGGRGKRFHVDHDHETGEVRGLLCWTCNRRLGVLEDVKFVKAAGDYLRKNM